MQAARGAVAQIVFRLGGADHDQMERIKDQVSKLCRGWSVERVTEIVTANLADDDRARLSTPRRGGCSTRTGRPAAM